MDPAEYFAANKRDLAQFKALWRTMTEEERETWVAFVRSSGDKPQWMFLRWLERNSL